MPGRKSPRSHRNGLRGTALRNFIESTGNFGTCDDSIWEAKHNSGRDDDGSSRVYSRPCRDEQQIEKNRICTKLQQFLKAMDEEPTLEVGDFVKWKRGFVVSTCDLKADQTAIVVKKNPCTIGFISAYGTVGGYGARGMEELTTWETMEVESYRLEKIDEKKERSEKK